MCGIAGIIGESNSQPVLQKMLEKIIHRGPDNTSVWSEDNVTLGHNRLKIIDLSDTANQPFEYDDLIVTYNGEVYNFKELRAELRLSGFAFRTNCDTEIIAAAYKKWGGKCVEHFEGMWALAIWDRSKRELFCSRDRFGIKPFYYLVNNYIFYFASEIKSLKTVPGFNGKLNEQQLKRGLYLGWSGYRDETIYSQIKSLPAAHNILLDKNGMNIYRYWDINNSSKEDTVSTQAEKENKFYALFEDSVRNKSISDVETGTCLSGGLDSSSIASVNAKLFPEKKIKTFTIYYNGTVANMDERPFAKTVIEKYPNIVPNYLSVSPDEAVDYFEKATYHADVPLSGSSFLSQFHLMKIAAKNNVRVLLDGQGSDEYLAGYMHTFTRVIANHLNNSQPVKALDIFLKHKKLHGLTTMQAIQEAAKSLFLTLYNEQKVYEHEYRKNEQLVSSVNKNKYPFELEEYHKNKVNNFFYHHLFTTCLPTLLHFEDRNSMAFSIESRVPFLDHRLVEYVSNLPVNDKISVNAETKYMLRQSLKGVLPDSVFNRHDKKGFLTPGETVWLRGSLQHLLELDYQRLEHHGIEPAKIKALVNNYKKGDNSKAQMVWRVASLNYWLKNAEAKV